MKKTAIDFLAESIYSNKEFSLSEIFKKAKEMEKHQIVEAHGTQLKKSRGVTNYEYWLNGEEYYNETFKSE